MLVISRICGLCIHLDNGSHSWTGSDLRRQHMVCGLTSQLTASRKKIQPGSRGGATCLPASRTRERPVHAWTSLDPELALRQSACARPRPVAARCTACDRRRGHIDTRRHPTEMVPDYRGHRPACDAACVALRARRGGAGPRQDRHGGVCRHFAGTDDHRTIRRTPGRLVERLGRGCGRFQWVPAAFGTQTGGSVLRPAAYWRRDRLQADVQPVQTARNQFAAESLDTIGLITRSIDDLELLTAVLVGRAPAAPRTLDAAPRIGLCRTPLWSTAQAEDGAAVDDAAQRLAAAGADVCEVATPSRSPGSMKRRARPSTTTNARNAWHRNGGRHRDQISKVLGDRIKLAWRCGTRTTLRRCASRGLPRLPTRGVRRLRCADRALRERRSAGRPRRDGRSRIPGVLDDPASADGLAADARGRTACPSACRWFAPRY